MSILRIILCLSFSYLFVNQVIAQKGKNIETDFNFDWKFIRGDQQNAYDPDMEDSHWQDIRLPHDWSVAESFTQENAAGATAFLPGGIGWYRKTFKMSQSAADKITRINFDGIYNNSEVWINGHLLGRRPYGYIGFYYDLTPYLKYGDKENVIAIKADRSAYVDCRWYPGSGIYRNVRLETVHKIHIKEWGTFITTPVVTKEGATVVLENTMVNADESTKSVTIEVAIQDTAGQVIQIQEQKIELKAKETKKISQTVIVSKPRLWDIENPNLYQAIISIKEGGKILDIYQETFGIRTIEFDAQKGFFLNGKKTIFKGVCLHHDGGLVGAAVPIGIWERRLKILKEGGTNAIRTAHNPPAADFLDLCDRMGFLVFDEIFDEWDNPKDKRHNYNQQKAEEVTKGYTEHIHEWGERDLKNMVYRDRNHPSIVAWSIGNEIEWTYPSYRSVGYWDKDKPDTINYYYDEPYLSPEKIKERYENSPPDNYELATMAKNLSKWTKEIDKSRPVTANLVIPAVSYFSGYTNALDFVGLSYRQSVYDYVGRLYPEKLILGSENWAQWHEWKAVLENKKVHGIFLWTGIYYMGESRKWPTKGSSSGLLDFAAYKRPSYHLFKTLWKKTPHIYMTTVPLEKSKYELVDNKVLDKKRNEKYIPMWGWPKYEEHWNYSDKESTVVEVFTNCPSVELFLNNVSLGVQNLADNYADKIMQWHVPFQKGNLTAVGTNTDGSTITYALQTAEELGGISIKTDKTELRADGYDVAHIEVELTDKNGVPVRNNDQKIEFDIQGKYRLLGVDNGANDNVQNIQTNSIITRNGRCLLLLQSLREKGELIITAKSGNLQSKTIKLTSK